MDNKNMRACDAERKPAPLPANFTSALVLDRPSRVWCWSGWTSAGAEEPSTWPRPDPARLRSDIVQTINIRRSVRAALEDPRRSAGALHPPPTGRPTPTPTAAPPPTRRRSPARGRSLSPAPRGSPAPRPSQCGSPLATSSCRSSASIRRAVSRVTTTGQALPRSARCAPRAGQPEDRAQSPEDVRLDALREQRKLRLARVDGLPAHGDDAGRVWPTALSPHSVSTPVPGSVTSMLPVHAHWHFESSVSAGTAFRVTMLDPGDHGAGITGIQG